MVSVFFVCLQNQPEMFAPLEHNAHNSLLKISIFLFVIDPNCIFVVNVNVNHYGLTQVNP